MPGLVGSSLTNSITLCRLDKCVPGWLRCLSFNINDNEIVNTVANIKGGIGVMKKRWQYHGDNSELDSTLHPVTRAMQMLGEEHFAASWI